MYIFSNGYYFETQIHVDSVQIYKIVFQIIYYIPILYQNNLKINQHYQICTYQTTNIFEWLAYYVALCCNNNIYYITTVILGTNANAGMTTVVKSLE